jgi:hypothetical protein
LSVLFISSDFVTGLADNGTGLVIVMNHVLADGIGGLAVLARLVDPVPGLPPAGPQTAPFPAPAPRVRALAADAWAGRARHLAHPADSLRRIGQGFAELGGHPGDRPLPAGPLPNLEHHLYCTCAQLTGISFRLWHDSILSKDWSLQDPRGGPHRQRRDPGRRRRGAPGLAGEPGRAT